MAYRVAMDGLSILLAYLLIGVAIAAGKIIDGPDRRTLANVAMSLYAVGMIAVFVAEAIRWLSG